MDTQRAIKPHDAVPRVYKYPAVRPEGEVFVGTKGVCYDTIPVFGPWTMAMMSSLRAMFVAEHEGDGDKDRLAQIERAYNYLYTRRTNKRRK